MDEPVVMEPGAGDVIARFDRFLIEINEALDADAAPDEITRIQRRYDTYTIEQ